MPEAPSSVRGAGLGGLAGLALLLAASGCQDRNRGVSPDGAGMYFPSGVALDPRVPDNKRARWLFVLNGNSDLVYNAGTLMPVDLRGFFDAWMLDPDRCFGTLDNPATADVDETVDPDPAYCGPGPCPGCGDPAFEPNPADPDRKPPRVGDVGSTPTEDIPCRRNAYKPQVVECEDTFFIEESAAVHLGNFGTSLRGWTREVVQPGAACDDAAPCGSGNVCVRGTCVSRAEGHLFAAVRGDPSITWVRVTYNENNRPAGGDPHDVVPVLDCGQGSLYDPDRCAGKFPDLDEDGTPSGEAHLLTYLRNDPDTIRIASEPTNILAIPGDPRVMVTHATRSAVTMIDMDGQLTVDDDGELVPDGVPAITQMRAVFEIGGVPGGGWGLARRPCTPDNAPSLTYGKDASGALKPCQRPMVYAGFRTALYVARMYIAEIDPLDGASVDQALATLAGQIADVEAQIAMTADPDELAELEVLLAELQAELQHYTTLKEALLDDPDDPDDDDYQQKCLLAEDIFGDALYDEDRGDPPTKGSFLCDAKLFGAGLFRAAAWDTGTTSGSAQLGDMAFSRDGNRLFAVQTNPGGLAYIDTSLNEQGRTRDQSAGVIELCAAPTALTIFYAGEQEYAAVTCYKPSELFIVDLGQVRVIGNVSLGNGPHPMAVDPARNLMYIANTLDKTLSVVDLSPKRVTRFSEIARLGRQVPYNR